MNIRIRIYTRLGISGFAHAEDERNKARRMRARIWRILGINIRIQGGAHAEG